MIHPPATGALLHSCPKAMILGICPKLIFRRDRYLRGGDHSAFTGSLPQFALPEYREDTTTAPGREDGKRASNMVTC